MLYGLEIQYQQESKWQLLKSFDDFMELNKKLSKIIPNAPTPPQKGLFATAGGDALYKQKVDLEKYLKVSSATTSYRFIMISVAIRSFQLVPIFSQARIFKNSLR